MGIIRTIMTTKKTAFNASWLLNANWSKWLVQCPTSPYSATRKVCLKSFALSNMGKKAVTSHEQSQKHIKNIKGLTHADPLGLCITTDSIAGEIPSPATVNAAVVNNDTALPGTKTSFSTPLVVDI